MSEKQNDVVQLASHTRRGYSGHGMVAMAVGMLTIGVGAGYVNPVAIAAGACLFLLGYFLFSVRTMKCQKCGFNGSPVRKGYNSFLALALWCCFILPGVIYTSLCPTRYFCRKCGEQALD